AAYTYQARPSHIDGSLMPYGWYRDLVASGARYHGLPDTYVSAIREQPAVSDPDGAREGLHRRLLQRMVRDS
ncbi:MAG: gamma-glutamylcyclotransferase, partial [Pseudomonadota bacterium]